MSSLKSMPIFRMVEAATGDVLPKKMFVKISQNSHRCFLVNFAKFLITPFQQNTSGRVLLEWDLIPVLPVPQKKKTSGGIFNNSCPKSFQGFIAKFTERH